MALVLLAMNSATDAKKSMVALDARMYSRRLISNSFPLRYPSPSQWLRWEMKRREVDTTAANASGF
jgi:hypothetical protein